MAGRRKTLKKENTDVERRLERVLAKDLFFVAATERTDLGWLARMIDAHPNATCELSGFFASRLLPALSATLDDVARATDHAESRRSLLLDLEGRQFLERTALALALAEMEAATVKALGDATADNIRHLEHLRTLLPNARFIVVVRDGRDIAADSWDEACKRRPNPQFERWFSDHVRSTAHFWCQDVASAIAFAERHPDRCLVVRIEELTANPISALKGVFALLGLSKGSAILQSCIAAAAALKPREGAGWRHSFDRHALDAFMAIAGETLDQLGYERNEDFVPEEMDEQGEDRIRQPALEDDIEARARESELRAATAAHPDDSSAQFRLAHFLWKRGRLGEALPLLERTLTLAPENYFAANLLTMTLSRLGRIEEAIASGHRALVIKDKAACAFFDSHAELRTLKLRRVERPFSEDPRRNVISFSLWGDSPIYTEGAIQNVEIARYMYPCWSCRFYVDDTVPKSVIDRLRALKAEIAFVPPAERGPHGGAWRFYAADDSGIDRFISRDCDSRLNAQERMAVDEWVASGKAVHIMRDNVWHNELILAGLWGAVTGAVPPLKQLIAAGRWFGKSRWYDQFFLWGVVWPLVRKDHLAHDTFFRFGQARPFPQAGRLPSSTHVGDRVRVV